MPTLLDRIHARSRPQPYRSDGQPEADFELWEDGDDIPVPKVSLDVNDGEDDGFGPASQTDDYGNVPNANPTSFDRYRGAIEKKAAWDQTRPNISDHKPKLWQRLLAGAAGGAAGYVNAGGRVRVDPKSMGSINEALLRPGYRRDMESWSDQAGKIDAEVSATGREAQLDSQREKAKLDAERAAAYGKSQEANVRYRERQMDELGKDIWTTDPQGHFQINKRTGEKRVLNEPKAPPSPKETEAEAVARREMEVENDTVLTPFQKRQYALTGKLPTPPQPRAGGRGRAVPRRIGTPGEFNTVRKDKVGALQKLESDLSKRLEELNSTYPGDGDDPATKNARVEWQKKHDKLAAEHEQKKKIVMAEYDAGVTGLGGSVVPRQAPAPTAPTPAAPPPSTAPAGPPPGASIKKRSEAEVRAAAIAAKKDPDAVVEAVRKAGGLL